MLTVDLVRVRREGDRIAVRPLEGQQRERARAIAARYLEIAADHHGGTREDFEARCAEVDVAPRDRRLADGLLKLVLDRCTFEPEPGADPPALRRAVFQRAAAARRALTAEQTFDRRATLEAVAAEQGLDPADLERLLFADLKGAHRLVAFDAVSPDRLVRIYDRSQGQAVLLRATRVTVEVHADPPTAYRALFHKLKFLRLLAVVHPMADGGYRLEIDGPYSLFSSVTKYGLQLALLIPALDEVGRWSLDAEVLWGKEKQRLRFHLEGGPGPGARPDRGDRGVRLADDVAALLAQFRKLDTPWRVATARKILHLPGAGICVPDLVFTHAETGERVYLEVLGFWSRAAVWRRVELVEAGLPDRIIFAVSSRLRVSEKALPPELPGSLYVYKGVMSARRIAELLDRR